MKTLEELMARREELVSEARQVFDDMANASGSTLTRLEKRHDDLMDEIDKLNPDIRRLGKHHRAEASIADAAAGAANARRPLVDGEARADDPGAPRFSTRNGSWADRDATDSGWIDQRGNPVSVLSPGKRWVSGDRSEVSMGDAVRAKIFGPRNDAEKRALSEGTDSAGGYTVPTPLAVNFIDRLRRQSVAVRAGAMTVPMESETLAIARLETDPTVAWRAENASLAEGDPTFGRVLFTAKSLSGMLKISRELMADTVNAGAIIENALVRAMALELDRAAIYGDGTSNSPTGVINVSGINEVSMGTNGAALSGYDELIDAIYEMQVDNADDPTAAVMHPRTGAALAKLLDGDGNPLTVPEMVRKVPMLSTTAAPIDETQGTATDASSIVYGDFTQLMIGLRESITVQVLNERYADAGQIGLVVHARADMQLAHKESFSRLKGIIPA